MKNYIPTNYDIDRKLDLDDFLNNLDNDMKSRN